MIVLDKVHLEYTVRNNENKISSGLHVEYLHDSISRDLFQDILERMLFDTTIEPNNKAAPAPSKADIPDRAPAADQGTPGPAADQIPQALGTRPGAAPRKKKKTPPVPAPEFAPGQQIRVIKAGKSAAVDEVGTVIKSSGPNILVEFGPDDGRWVRRRNCAIVTPGVDKHVTTTPT
ncbi:MAG: hypothetical protein ABR999_08985 [Methanoregula sp.]|jgi:hypothetical protein|uniref:hypothetical protein n=1 Tax=Methanoregula sp. TaxID=2052170 RepID=UPI003D0AFAD8